MSSNPRWRVIAGGVAILSVTVACSPGRAATSGSPRQTGEAASPLKLIYVANMGVLVGSGETKVLIDALSDKPNPDYRAPAPETIDKMMKGAAPQPQDILSAVKNGDLELVRALLKKKGFPTAPPEYPKISAPYIDPELPGEEPRRFAPGIIFQPHHFEHAKLSFTADMTTACWADWQRMGTSKVFVMEKRDGLWQAPRTVLLNATMPFIAPDGMRIFFTAPRVLPDGREAGDSDIYCIQRTEAGWTDRVNLGPGVNTEQDEIQPSVNRDGAVYFAHRADIYRSKLVDGRYAPKERLPVPVNDDSTQAMPFVAPDGGFLLYLSLGQSGMRDPKFHFSSVNADGTWTDPVNIAKKVNKIGLFPSLTPDNRFMISFEGGDLFWFDIGAVMEELTGSTNKRGDSK